MPKELTVAVLGAGGTMGRPMACNIARAGMDVRAWNRSQEKAEPLAADGVHVADTGTYRVLGDDPAATALENGHLSFWLEGSKLRGGFALTRVGGGGRERWLLVKKDDEGADRRRNPVSTEARSVLSGATVKELARRG